MRGISLRITNDDYTPVELLSELISIVPGSLSAKELERRYGDFFALNGRDSHDWIVEAWSERIDAILNSYCRTDTYCSDTQSMSDRGIDARLAVGGGRADRHVVGFQLKSNNEAVKNRARKKVGYDAEQSLVSILKAQQTDARRHGGIDEWWIVCCFEMPKFRKLVGTINAEFTTGNSEDNKYPARIVQPLEVAAFLDMSKEDVDLYATLFLCKDDMILSAASQEMDALTERAQSVVYGIFGAAIEGDSQISREDLYELLNDNDKLEGNDEDAGDVFEKLTRLGFFSEGYEEPVTVHPAVLPGLCALYFEMRVRHGASPGDDAIRRAAWLISKRRSR